MAIKCNVVEVKKCEKGNDRVYYIIEDRGGNRKEIEDIVVADLVKQGKLRVYNLEISDTGELRVDTKNTVKRAVFNREHSIKLYSYMSEKYDQVLEELSFGVRKDIAGVCELKLDENMVFYRDEKTNAGYILTDLDGIEIEDFSRLFSNLDLESMFIDSWGLDCFKRIDFGNVYTECDKMLNTFRMCKNLVEVLNFPKSVKYLKGAFIDCENLVKIPEMSSDAVVDADVFYYSGVEDLV